MRGQVRFMHGFDEVVVRQILCSHLTVKMTSWGFPDPTHTGHNIGHKQEVTLQSRGQYTVKGVVHSQGVRIQSREYTVKMTSWVFQDPTHRGHSGQGGIYSQRHHKKNKYHINSAILFAFTNIPLLRNSLGINLIQEL